MVARFVGRYEHSLDAEGRVILPAKLRPPFDQGGYVSQYHEGCLALWTPEEFEKQMLVRQEAATTPHERNLARVWASGSHEIEIDRQGRLAIPAHLRDFAGLAGDVLVHGAIDRVELWDPAAWEQRVKPVEREFVEAGAATSPPDSSQT